MEVMVKVKLVQVLVEVGVLSFLEMFFQVVDKVNEIQQVFIVMVNVFEVGQSGVDLIDVMIVSQKVSVLFQVMIQVCNKLVQVY